MTARIWVPFQGLTPSRSSFHGIGCLKGQWLQWAQAKTHSYCNGFPAERPASLQDPLENSGMSSLDADQIPRSRVCFQTSWLALSTDCQPIANSVVCFGEPKKARLALRYNIRHDGRRIEGLLCRWAKCSEVLPTKARSLRACGNK